MSAGCKIYWFFFQWKTVMQTRSLIVFLSLVLSCLWISSFCISFSAKPNSCWSTLTLIVGKIWKSPRTSKQFGFPCSSKQYLRSVEERNSGLKLLLSKRWYKNKTPWQNRQTDGINFIFGWTIPLTLIKQQKTEKNHSLFLTEKL